VFGMNDESVLGGVRALEGRGFTAEHIAGIGIGGTSAVQEWKKEKPTGFIGSVLLSPKRHGQETAELLVQWITKGTVPPSVTYTTGTLINRANQVQIMREHGL
jgi:L-arabinose transport system substrate-binding protein